jgi:MoaA/NifB/PqqE/SkfB family radical SAM enzyme
MIPPTVNVIPPTYPTHLIIETSTICNLKCVMCTHSDAIFDREKQFLSDNIINKIEPFLFNAKYLQLHGMGEPLLSTSFWKIITKIRRETYSEINSNLVSITDEQMDILVKSNLSSIRISIDSPNVDTYRKIRGFDLSVVIDNVKRLVQKRNENKSNLGISLNMTLMKENINEIKECIDLCKSLNCDMLYTWTLNNKEGEYLNKNLYGWSFIYKDQNPYNFKEYFNTKVYEAIEYAKKVNVLFSYYVI